MAVGHDLLTNVGLCVSMLQPRVARTKQTRTPTHPSLFLPLHVLPDKSRSTPITIEWVAG